MKDPSKPPEVVPFLLEILSVSADLVSSPNSTTWGLQYTHVNVHICAPSALEKVV